MTSSPSRPFTSSCVALLLAASSAAIAACGGAEAGAPSNKSPSAEPTKTMREEPEPEPKTVEEAQDQIARMRASLDQNSDSKKAAAGPEERPSSAAPTTPSTSQNPQAGAGLHAEQDSCGNPCRALMSMKHAVDALCRMTSDSDNRCVDARKTLSDSTVRVSPCKCSL